MSEGKKIEIKIAATGGDQAAAEVRKVEEAGKSLANPQTSTGFGGMLDKLPEQAEAATEKARDLNAEVDALVKKMGEVSEETEAAGEALEKAGDKAGGLAENTDKAGKPANTARLKEVALASGAIGLATAAAAKTFGQIQEAFDSIDLEKLREIDAAMADQIETTKTWTMALEDPIGTLLKLTTGETVGSAFETMNAAIAGVAKQHEEAIDRLIEKGITQRDELKAMADAIKAANSILDAKDAADGKARDRADEKAIRDGAVPEDVKSQRAADNAEKEIARINRDLDAKAAAVQAAYENSQRGKVNLDQVSKQDGAAKNPEFMEKARKQAEDLQKEFERQKADFATAQQIAAEKRRGVREEAAGTGEDLSADKTARMKKEQEDSAKKAAVEAKRAAAAAATEARKQEAAEKRAGRSDIDEREDSLDATARSRGLNMRGAGNKSDNKTLQTVGKALADGTDAAELQKLGDLVREKTGENGAALTSMMLKVLDGMTEQAKQIEILKKRFGNR